MCLYIGHIALPVGHTGVDYVMSLKFSFYLFLAYFSYFLYVCIFVMLSCNILRYI